MEHPTDQQWMDLLYGELAPEERRALEEHLTECPACRGRMDAWRGVTAALDSWRLPARLPRPRRAARLLRWAVAAALLVGLGFAFARIGIDRDALRAELRAEWRQELAEARAEIEGRLEKKLRTEIDQVALETFNASSALTSRRLEELADWLHSARRSDLYTLASLTEQELLRARRDVAVALAARSDLRTSVSTVSTQAPSDAEGR